jgi:hypothetical protein
MTNDIFRAGVGSPTTITLTSDQSEISKTRQKQVELFQRLT